MIETTEHRMNYARADAKNCHGWQIGPFAWSATEVTVNDDTYRTYSVNLRFFTLTLQLILLSLQPER